MRSFLQPLIIIIIIIIIHTFVYRREVVTSKAVAEEVRSRQSLSVIMSQMKQVSFKPRLLKYVNEELPSAVLGSEFQTAGA